MAISKTFLPLIFLSLFVLLGTATTELDQGSDPERELQQCMQRCQVSRMETQECQRRCLERYQEQKKQHGQDDEVVMVEQQGRGDPEREYRECKQDCQERSRGEQERRQCVQRCQQGSRGREGEEQRENPYHFRRQHFETRFGSQQGNMWVLERFNKRSELLRGIENYRIAFIQAKPNTFVLPNHCDAETVLYVARGSGIINLVRRESRESRNVKCGDVLRIRAGTIIYLVNHNEREELKIAKLAMPVSTPGRFEEFFGAGGENPESYYTTFSSEIMEAAFNADWGRLQKLFHHREGPMVRASREQLQALRKHSSNWLLSNAETEENEPYSLLKRTVESNRYGKLYEARPNEYRPLKELDVAVSLANVSSKAMIGPYYNSRSTKVALVIEGSGYYEMACPYLASQERERQGRGESEERGRGASYKKVRGSLSPGDVFVVPAGHPIATVSSTSQNENLEIVCFNIDANGNERIPLAGKDNALKQLEDVAAELSFGAQRTEIQQIFNKQQNSFFYPGPEARQQGQDAYA